MFNSTNFRRLMLAAVLAAGCSDAPPVADPATAGAAHPVSGQVIYDGKPAAGVSVSLMSAGGGAVLPRGTTGPDGAFKLSSFGKDDGAPAGNYRVILRWPPEPKPDEEQVNADRLLGWYEAGTTTLFITVKPGENALPAFKLPKRDKPAEAPPGIPGMN